MSEATTKSGQPVELGTMVPCDGGSTGYVMGPSGYAVSVFVPGSEERECFMVIADGECDQICETRTDANREKNDLTRMGCEAKVRRFPSWRAAEAYETKLRGH